MKRRIWYGHDHHLSRNLDKSSIDYLKVICDSLRTTTTTTTRRKTSYGSIDMAVSQHRLTLSRHSGSLGVLLLAHARKNLSARK